jgi:DNA-binding transcriptional regulator YiaG
MFRGVYPDPGAAGERAQHDKISIQGDKLKSREPRELAPKRIARLREILRMDHVVSVEELSRQLKVSSATVRRDLA